MTQSKKSLLIATIVAAAFLTAPSKSHAFIFGLFGDNSTYSAGYHSCGYSCGYNACGYNSCGYSTCYQPTYYRAYRPLFPRLSLFRPFRYVGYRANVYSSCYSPCATSCYSSCYSPCYSSCSPSLSYYGCSNCTTGCSSCATTTYYGGVYYGGAAHSHCCTPATIAPPSLPSTSSGSTGEVQQTHKETSAPAAQQRSLKPIPTEDSNSRSTSAPQLIDPRSRTAAAVRSWSFKNAVAGPEDIHRALLPVTQSTETIEEGGWRASRRSR